MSSPTNIEFAPHNHCTPVSNLNRKKLKFTGLTEKDERFIYENQHKKTAFKLAKALGNKYDHEYIETKIPEINEKYGNG